MSASGIYAIINTLNGKHYVGQAANIGYRFVAHQSLLRRGKHHNKELQRVGVASAPTRGMKLSDEQRAHLSSIRTGKKKTPEWIAKIQVKSRVSWFVKGNAPLNKAGYKLSDETRRRMSEAKKKYIFPEEHCRNLSLAKKKWWADRKAMLRLPVIIGALPQTLTNGTTADATQVMADLNWIVNQVNANAAPLATTALTNANNNFTVVQSGVAASAAANFPIASQVQNSVFLSLSSTLGTNTLTARCATLPLAAYAVGQIFTFVPSQPNTGAATIAVDTAGAIPFLADNVPLKGGEFRQNVPVQFYVDANTNAQLLGVSAGQVQNGGLSTLTSTLGTNTLTARSMTLPLNAYATGQIFTFTPSQTNTGAVGITVDLAGSSSIFSGGASLIGNELSAGIPSVMVRDASKFNLLASPAAGTTATTFTFNGSGGSTAALTLTWQRIGKFVTLNIPAALATAGTGSTALVSDTALPASVRPTTTQYSAVNTENNAGAASTSAGIINVGTNGIISLNRDNSLSGWTNAQSGGLSVAISITYFIG